MADHPIIPRHHGKKRRSYEAIIQSIIQSINQSINQSIT
jgi:hypothetical protein